MIFLSSYTDGSSIFDAMPFEGYRCKVIHCAKEKGYAFQRDLYYQYKIFSLLLLLVRSLFDDYKDERTKVVVSRFIP